MGGITVGGTGVSVETAVGSIFGGCVDIWDSWPVLIGGAVVGEHAPNIKASAMSSENNDRFIDAPVSNCLRV